jgi:hypothetical protein
MNFGEQLKETLQHADDCLPNVNSKNEEEDKLCQKGDSREDKQ